MMAHGPSKLEVFVPLIHFRDMNNVISNTEVVEDSDSKSNIKVNA